MVMSRSYRAPPPTYLPSPRRQPISPSSHPLRIEHRPLTGAVALECALLADRVGTLEDPVLPGGQPREDFRFHRLRAAEAQIGFEPGETVGREAGALFEKHPHLVPIDVVERKGHKTELLRRFGFEHRAAPGFGAIEVSRIGEKAARQPRD